jgi:hypothetical protein
VDRGGIGLPQVFNAVPMVEDCVGVVWMSLVLLGGEARRELYACCGEL